MTLVSAVRDHLALTGHPVSTAAMMSAVRASGAAPVGELALVDVAARVRSELTGAGPLDALLVDPEVTDIVVNGPAEVWVDRGDGLCPADITFPDEAAVRQLAQRLAATCGRRLDESQPFVDARLRDGTRVHAAIPPIATNGTSLSLRTYRRRGYTLSDLSEAGTCPPAIADLLERIVHARLAFLVSGGTGTGKTTLLATLLNAVEPTERLVVLEDSPELMLSHPHAVHLVARPANAEGAGAVGMRTLVREALRMRPDRIVVGECRGAEIVEFLAALNTGHDGGAGTLHANTPHDVVARLEALALPGGLDRIALHSQLSAALQVVIHLRRHRRRRVIEHIGVLVPADHDRVTVRFAWSRQHDLGPAAEQLAALLRTRHIDPPDVLDPTTVAGGRTWQ